MSIAQGIILIFAFCAMAVTLFVIGAFIFNAVWLWRPRWTVWYPPDPKFGFKGAWRQRCDYWTARDYASIFNGTVYTLKARRKLNGTKGIPEGSNGTGRGKSGSSVADLH